ncbi:NUDIX hydrolase [Candidatus Nanohalovita haloferacivicina]|uniref:NUDIX hydrolase n=1 Tax=Candidatus Nanohalovita haloferacivicina TaxID=2978046 RepID=UPI00325FC00F|nr:NUDIX family hydrolase [Candidatus Nanohalobia archaeon BNXNv]
MNNSHLAAAAIATNQEGEILMVQEGKGQAKGTWTFPGGSFEDREQLRETAEREFLEETGYSIETGPVIGVYLEESVRTGNTVAVFLYEAQITERRHSGLNDGEILDAQFFSPHQIQDLNLGKENRRKMLEDYLEGRGFSQNRITDTR